MTSRLGQGGEIALPPREGRVYRFSELRGLRVCRRSSGETVGRSRDLVMTLVGDELVTRLLVIRSTGELATWLVPWEAIACIGTRSIEVDVMGRARVFPASPSGLPVRIGRDVLRRRIVDRDGGRVGMVHDARLVMERRELALLDLDVSVFAAIAGLLRVHPRMCPHRLVPWSAVEPGSVGIRPQPLCLRPGRAQPAAPKRVALA